MNADASAAYQHRRGRALSSLLQMGGQSALHTARHRPRSRPREIVDDTATGARQKVPLARQAMLCCVCGRRDNAYGPVRVGSVGAVCDVRGDAVRWVGRTAPRQ